MPILVAPRGAIGDSVPKPLLRAPRLTTTNKEHQPKPAIQQHSPLCCSFLAAPTVKRHSRAGSVEPEINVDILPPVTVRPVGRVNFDALDKLVHLLGGDVREMFVPADYLNETVNVVSLLFLSLDELGQLCDGGFQLLLLILIAA